MTVTNISKGDAQVYPYVPEEDRSLVKEQIDLTGRADAGMTGALDSVVQEVAGIITSTLDINQVYEKSLWK